MQKAERCTQLESKDAPLHCLNRLHGMHLTMFIGRIRGRLFCKKVLALPRCREAHLVSERDYGGAQVRGRAIQQVEVADPILIRLVRQP